MRNAYKQREPVRGENSRGTRVSAESSLLAVPLILTTDQKVVIASAPSEPPLIRGDSQRRMEETIVRTDDRTEVGMIACCASRPWVFGPRLGHIRVRKDEMQCEMMR